MIRALKKLINFMFSRLFLVALMLALQFAVLFAVAFYFSTTVFYFYLLFHVLSIFAMVCVVSINENPAYKLTWIIAILSLPVIGWLFYLLLGNKRMPAKLQRRIDHTLEDTRRGMPPNHLCEQLLAPADSQLAVQGRYIYNIAGYPVLSGTTSEYFPLGERMFERMLEKLGEARRYIFLEYFIIRPGQMWNAVFDILRQKADEGVEVWLMHDDLGCIGTLPKGFDRMIRKAGIRLCVFNSFRPRVSVILNHRDHRKMTVIDGEIAFCGGINLADEYINQYERFGHWKDTGVMLEGDAAWPFAFLFLQLWQFSTDDAVDFDHYRPRAQGNPTGELVQPFGDSPLDSFNVTENAYLSAVSCATRYVYITTPYLVIDYEMELALCSAARSGVDVRLITPHIPDKWYVHLLTRSHYAQLIRAGVRIYEYTPGFMHGKMFVADDKVCMVGTCNMDFRSFYLHFECSVLFYHVPSIIGQVKQDMLDCQSLSHLVTLEEALTLPPHMRIIRAILKLFAPLM